MIGALEKTVVQGFIGNSFLLDLAFRPFVAVDTDANRERCVGADLDEARPERRYKQEYIRFLTFALASCDETTDHLETLYETGSLKDEALYKNLHQRLQTLGKKINRFIQSVEKEHRTDV